jgi:hypothetical protein
MPAVAEKVAKKYANRQQYDEAPRHPEGALYQPSGSGHIHGSGGVTPH